MPTTLEQIAQVETALRRRFFPLVPRVDYPERKNWTEEQHDTDRLSRSLAAYAIVGLAEVDDVTAARAVTDGKNDGGIDAVYFLRSQSRLIVVQSKFKRSGTAPAQDEILKTINGIKSLLNRRFNEFNTHFQSRLDEIEEALDTPGVVVAVSLVYLGSNLGPHVTNDLNALQAEMNRLNEVMTWSAHGLSTVYAWLVAEQTPSAVSASFTLENWSLITSPRRAVYGQISAASLAQLVQEKGRDLFQRNIRHYLGSVGVNNAIEETVRRRPGDFFYLNNGLTAVAERITSAAGTPERCVFSLTNVSIVNGAQTAGAIANAAIAGDISPDAKVLATIIEIGTGSDDIGMRITKARNHQNVVRNVDFAALDATQERLRQELAVVGITYHYRPSAEARMRRDDAFTLEEAAIAIACLSERVLSSAEAQAAEDRGQSIWNAVDFVVFAKKEISRLWDQKAEAYHRLFRPDLSGVRMCRLVRMFRFIDSILAATEASETEYARRMFFRHGRYFTMAFVAQRSADIVNQPREQLTEDEKQRLSRCINELGELIYVESAAFHGLKGYLAVFRNLTDSQPLADRVLARLAERDRVAVQDTSPSPREGSTS
ncbi:MAG: AIPR family protein [Thermoguttaceae bacterium]